MFPNDHSPSQDTARDRPPAWPYTALLLFFRQKPHGFTTFQDIESEVIISSNVQFDIRRLNRGNRNHIKAKTRVQTTQTIQLAFVLYLAALPCREVHPAAGHCTRGAATPSCTHGTRKATGNYGGCPEVFVLAPFKAGRNLHATCLYTTPLYIYENIHCQKGHPSLS